LALSVLLLFPLALLLPSLVAAAPDPQAGSDLRAGVRTDGIEDGSLSATPVTLTLSLPASTISGSVILTATVSRQVAATRAVLSLDGTPRAVSTGDLFTWDWVTTLTANGEHSLMVEVYSTPGKLVASGETTATVDNAVAPKRWMPAGLSERQVRDVETSPGESGVAYAAVGTAVYRTIDWRGFWGALAQGLPPHISAHSLAVAPGHPERLFLGTDSGVYASEDGGETWEPRGLTDKSVWDLGVGGAAGSWVYAVTSAREVYRSESSGDTWSLVLADAGLLYSISVDAVDDQVAYVGCGDPWSDAVVWRTTDGGSTWERAVLVSPAEVRALTHIHSSDPETIYAGVTWGPGGVHKSTDRGRSWDMSLPGQSITALARARADGQMVYAASSWGSHVFLTEDGGEHWKGIRDGLPIGTDLTALAVDAIAPEVAYATDADRGLWSTVYTATHPVPFVAGVGPHVAYNDRATIITITGTNFVPTPDVVLGSTPLLDVTFVTSTTVIATVPAGLAAGPYDLTISNPSGQIGHLRDCFTLLTPPEIEITEPVHLEVVSGSIAIRTVTGKGGGIWKAELYLDDVLRASSVISPYNWIWASHVMGNGPHEIQVQAYDLAGRVAASAPVHVVVDNLIEEAQWTRLAFDGERIEDLVTGPTAGMMWVLTNDGLYRSTDYGATWNRADAGLPSGIQYLAVGTDLAPEAPIYAANWRDIFVSRDGGESWLPEVQLASNLAYLDIVDGSCFAATYDSQVFRRLPTGEWDPVGDPLSGIVYDVASYQSRLYAGTSEGLHRLTAESWEPVTVDAHPLYYHTPATWFERGLKPRATLQVETRAPTISVHSIIVLDGTMYLGTDGARGVYRSRDGETWTACDVGLTGPYYHSVRKLAADSRGWLFAATMDGVFVSWNEADRWQALDAGLPHTLTDYGVLLDNVTATSLVIADEREGQHILGSVFNTEGVWRLVLADESLLQPLPSESPPKAVLIVGPVDPPDHTATLSYIEWSDRLAQVMEDRGMNVVRVYWPDSTWENVRAAISGASVVVYKGHGFGCVSDPPPDPTEMAGGCNGFTLVHPEDPMGARLATQDMLVATSQLANDAVAFYFCCYCAGHSSADPEPVSKALARRRIEAYSSTHLRMGGRAYFSGADEESVLADLLDHPDRTLGEIYEDHGGDPDHAHTHVLWPDVGVWFDGDAKWGWGRAFVGEPLERLFLDATPPANPTSLDSTSHTTATWSRDNMVHVTWSGAWDDKSGVDGYSFGWTTSSSTVPDAVKDCEETTTSVTSPPLADSDRVYFHIRTVDYKSNWNPGAAHLGPFWIDSALPTSSASSSPYEKDSPILVRWTASDGHSGVSGTSLWTRQSGGAWTDSGLPPQSGTSGVFSFTPSEENDDYCFATRSMDNAGNSESVPTGTGDSCTIYDTTPPVSAVDRLPIHSRASGSTIGWSGWDNLAGVASYDVYRRVGAGEWQLWLNDTSESLGTLSGTAGDTMYFYSQATDRAGNVEASEPGDGGDAHTTLANYFVSGKVMDNRGADIPFAVITSSPGHPGPDVVRSTESYEFGVIDPGFYDVHVAHSDFGALPPVLGLSVTEDREGIDFWLPPPDNVVVNWGFEEGTFGPGNWVASGAITPVITTTAHTGNYAALLVGQGSPVDAVLTQTVAIPDTMDQPTLSLLYRLVSGGAVSNTFQIAIRGVTDTVYALPLAQRDEWIHVWTDLSAYRGQTMTLECLLAQGVPYRVYMPTVLRTRSGASAAFPSGAGKSRSHPITILLDEICLGSAAEGPRRVWLPVVLKEPPVG